MSEIKELRVVQTSRTTFELQTENGCIALAGFAIATMGEAGVYFLRHGCGLPREKADLLFRADPNVQKALACNLQLALTTNH